MPRGSLGRRHVRDRRRGPVLGQGRLRAGSAGRLLEGVRTAALSPERLLRPSRARARGEGRGTAHPAAPAPPRGRGEPALHDRLPAADGRTVRPEGRDRVGTHPPAFRDLSPHPYLPEARSTRCARKDRHATRRDPWPRDRTPSDGRPRGPPRGWTDHRREAPRIRLHRPHGARGRLPWRRRGGRGDRGRDRPEDHRGGPAARGRRRVRERVDRAGAAEAPRPGNDQRESAGRAPRWRGGDPSDHRVLRRVRNG